jgi:hypothetical protein
MKRPLFQVRSLDDGSGYAIDAIWPDAEIVQLPGIHKTPEDAAKWVNQHSQAYIKKVLAARPTNVIPFRRS